MEVATSPLCIIKLLDNGTINHADSILLRHKLHRENRTDTQFGTAGGAK